MTAPLPHEQTGSGRPLWLAAVALVVLSIGLMFGLQTLSHDREVTERQADALRLSKAALESQRASATLVRIESLEREAGAYAERKHASRIGFIVATVLGLTLLVALLVRTMRSNSLVLARLSQLAQEDPLTGIPNRRGLDAMLPVEFARARRNESPLTFVMLDLDFFKKYNDRRGHAAGDALLHGAAQAWAKQLRPTDLIARYGGEEFSLLLASCDADQAVLLVDRLRGLVPDRQTFSAGIATWDGQESAAEMMQRADQALLQAKRSGRNRSMIAGREPQVTLPLIHA